MRRIFEGPVWNYVGLESDRARPGDFRTTFVGEMPVIVVRGEGGPRRGDPRSHPARAAQAHARARPLRPGAPEQLEALRAVIPAETTLVVPVAGADVFGKRLDDDHVHRPEIVNALSGAPFSNLITPEVVARMLAEPEAGRKGVPARARVFDLRSPCR